MGSQCDRKRSSSLKTLPSNQVGSDRLRMRHQLCCCILYDMIARVLRSVCVSIMSAIAVGDWGELILPIAEQGTFNLSLTIISNCQCEVKLEGLILIQLLLGIPVFGIRWTGLNCE